jgi:hypothetical protein
MTLYHFSVYSSATCHVDEVQIDGGDTEEVVVGNIENPGKRIIGLFLASRRTPMSEPKW